MKPLQAYMAFLSLRHKQEYDIVTQYSHIAYHIRTFTCDDIVCLDCRVCCNLLANVMEDLGGNLGCTM